MGDEFDFTGFDNGGGDFVDGSSGDFVDGGSFNAAQFLPLATAAFSGGGSTVSTGQPQFQQVGAFGGIAAAGAGAIASLGGRLAMMMGRSGGRFVINGVKGSLASLWPYIRKYGPTAVAAALGITLEQLGAMAMAAPQGGARKRRRGISAADIRRAKRVIRFNKSLSRQLGTNRGSRRYYGGRSGRGRGHYAYIN